MPKVSVIIPTYNRAHLILETLESVFAQTYTDYEVIVVDDGSTDNTEEVLAPYRDRIRYIKQKNAGPAVARNRGILAAQGEYIAFQDSDDIWLPEKLEKQMNALIGSDYDLCFTDAGHGPAPFDDVKSHLHDFHTKSEGKPLFERFFEGCIFQMATIVFKKDLLAYSGLFDGVLHGREDHDLWMRFAFFGKVVCIDEILCYIRTENNDRTSNSGATALSCIHATSIMEARWKPFMKGKKNWINTPYYTRLGMFYQRNCGNIREAGQLFLDMFFRYHHRQWKYLWRGVLFRFFPGLVRCLDKLRGVEYKPDPFVLRWNSRESNKP